MSDFNVIWVCQSMYLWWTLSIVANCFSAYLFILWVVHTQLTKKKNLASTLDQSQTACMINFVVDECCWYPFKVYFIMWGHNLAHANLLIYISVKPKYRPGRYIGLFLIIERPKKICLEPALKVFLSFTYDAFVELHKCLSWE